MERKEKKKGESKEMNRKKKDIDGKIDCTEGGRNTIEGKKERDKAKQMKEGKEHEVA